MNRILIAAVLAAVWMQRSFAAELSLSTGEGPGGQATRILRIAGDITEGDSQKVAARLDQPRDKDSERSAVDQVTLAGEGGDFLEAVKIARLIGQSEVSTAVLAGDTCSDACAVAFMAGNMGNFNETTVRASARCLQEGGVLEFSIPTFAQVRTINPLEDRNAELARVARRQMFLFFVDLITLTREHEWPEQLVQAVLEAGISGRTIVRADYDPLHLLREGSPDDYYGIVAHAERSIDLGRPCPFVVTN
ncbi:hypothetical protein [Jiella sonneratiae]|uniref:Uncharacterized protein n=1 Tax=Jiella sonneratiae TaxID=2816856 RepID=A0ABS3J4N4_9HYPH|nr:hypothetical protein [Jiella sonneratiae]MBO0904619.1 hypothetical protein [Jiella sonneratiae]